MNIENKLISHICLNGHCPAKSTLALDLICQQQEKICEIYFKNKKFFMNILIIENS